MHSASTRRTRLRLFLIEAPSPLDLLERTAEAPALAKVCALIGHEVARFGARSKAEFRTICEFIASTRSKNKFSTDKRLCVHIAAHGNKDELGFGGDFVSWKALLKLIEPLCTKMKGYKGELILVISACGAAEQKLTRGLKKRAEASGKFRPPVYLFVTAEDEPTFADTVVAWTVFYHQLSNASLDNKKEVQAILDRVHAVGATKIMYYRWDTSDRCYLKWPRPLQMPHED